MAQNLAELLDALGLLGALPPAAGDDMRRLLTEWSVYFQNTQTVDTTPEQVKARASALSTLLDNPDRATELDLMRQACENPLLGVMLILGCFPGVASRQAQRWWDMIFSEQGSAKPKWEIKPNWNIKPDPLPAPAPATASAPATKYLIVSDLHRDATEDNLGMLQPGSVDHFSKNGSLCERVLKFAIDNKYTLIEVGDCEDLWYVPNVNTYPRKADGSLDVAARLQRIIDSHPGVYQRISALHKDHHYFRVYGNHDSFLKKAGTDDSVGQVLQKAIAGQSGPPLEIYDALVIDGVKTMMEHDGLALLGEAADLAAGRKQPAEFLAKLVRGHLGLDPEAYTEKRRMLVAHGHQFDVWNSPENEILGMLITNTVATFVDRQMDPFLDLRGIAFEGNPLVQFADLFSRWPVFNSWPAKLAAIRLAHQIQHTPNDKRVLNDSVVFSETIAALYGSFGIALNYRDSNNQEITPEKSRHDLDLTKPENIAEYLKRHHLHQLCIGHTHFPQSQPYLTLNNLAAVAFPLAPVIYGIQALLPSFLEPQVKTMYFNSGTGGWTEGVIWALEIDETGQTRQVYWTENSNGPEYMDWELQPLDPNVRLNLLNGLTAAFNGPIAETEQSLDGIWTTLKERLQELNVSGWAIDSALSRATTLPIYALAAALMAKPAETSRLRKLEEVPAKVGKKIEEKVDELEQQFQKLRSFTLDVLLSVKRRALSGFSSNADKESCVIRAPISQPVRARLDQFKRILRSIGMQEQQAQHYAGLAISIFHEFPRNLPFFSTLTEPLNPGARLDDSESPVLQSLLSTLWMYPPYGQTVNVHGVAIESRFALEDSSVSLTVTLSKSNINVS